MIRGDEDSDRHELMLVTQRLEVQRQAEKKELGLLLLMPF